MHTFNTAWQKLFGDKSAVDVLEASDALGQDPHEFTRDQINRLAAEDPYHGFDETHGGLFREIVETLERASRGENVGAVPSTLVEAGPRIGETEASDEAVSRSMFDTTKADDES